MKKISKEKKFKPKSGQTDYTNIRWAPVVNCVVMYRGKMLLVERSSRSFVYIQVIGTVFRDFSTTQKSLKEKVIEELREELGIRKNEVVSIRPGEVFNQDEPKYKKTWIVHPILVHVKTDTRFARLGSAKYKWVTLREAEKMKLLPGFDIVLQRIKKMV